MAECDETDGGVICQEQGDSAVCSACNIEGACNPCDEESCEWPSLTGGDSSDDSSGQTDGEDGTGDGRDGGAGRDGSDADGSDGSGDASTDADGADGSGGYTCVVVLQCSLDCQEDEACVQGCLDSTAEASAASVEALYTCADTNGCVDEACLQSYCPAELADCQSN